MNDEDTWQPLGSVAAKVVDKLQRKNDPVAIAILEVLRSPNEGDSNGEAANIVDGLFAIARAIDHLADALKK